jgi:hypothetical protein
VAAAIMIAVVSSFETERGPGLGLSINQKGFTSIKEVFVTYIFE